MISQDEVVTNNGEAKWLPYKTRTSWPSPWPPRTVPSGWAAVGRERAETAH